MTPPVVKLAHIIHLLQPFPQQKQSLASIILLLVMCFLPELSRHLLSGIVIAIVACTSWGAVAETVSRGLSWPRLAGSPDNKLWLVVSIGLPNN
jgi:hypothetical protein